MNLGNQSPAQFFGLFTAGELNFSKRTWILGRILFGLKFELKLVCFCLCHLLTGIINSSGSGSFLHFRASQDSSPLSCLKLILLIWVQGVPCLPSVPKLLSALWDVSAETCQYMMMMQDDEISGGSPGRNSLIFMWSSKRISREKLNIFSLNIFIPAVKQKLRQGQMQHWHHKQLSCINKIATQMWALLWNQMFVWEFGLGAHSSCFTDRKSVV